MAVPKSNYYVAKYEDFELLVKLDIISTANNIKGDVWNIEGDVTAKLWIRNISNHKISLITAAKYGPFAWNGLIMYDFKIDEFDGNIIRPRPSELDIVDLQANEMIALNDVRFDGKQLKNKTAVTVIYRVDDIAKKMFNVWSGQISARIELFGARAKP